MRSVDPAGCALGRSARPLAVLGMVAGLFATPALGQAPSALSVNGTLVIQGGGDGTDPWRFTGVTVGPGSDVKILSLSAAHPTLVIRGDKLFGDTCSKGADCWNTDICADNVCGWSGLDVSYAQCGDRTQLTALDQTFDDCIRLWAVDHPSQLTARADACMNAGSKVYGPAAVVSATCPQLEQYRDGYNKFLFDPPGTHRNILMKAVRNGVTTSINDTTHEVTRVGEIKSVLRVIDSWFRAQVARLGTANDNGLFAQTSDVAGAFWKAVFVDEVIGGQLPPVSASDAASIAEKIQRTGFVADKQVLRAAFDPDKPLQTAPLLLITADAVQGLAERTENFASLQDVVCRVRPCFPGRTSLGNYMKVLGTLAQDGGTLAAAIALANTNPYTGDPDTRVTEWKPVFDLMSQQHAVIEGAVLSARDQTAGYNPATLESDALDVIPKYAVPLASIVRGALTMSTAFENTGTFRPRPRQIMFGVDAARNEKIRVAVDNLCKAPGGVIPTAIASYQANEKDYITSALAVAQGAITSEKAKVQLDAIGLRYRNLASDMNGLRASKQSEDMQFGDFMRSFEGLAPAITDAGQRIVVSAGTQDIDVGASHARFNAGTSLTDITQIAVRRANDSIWKLSRSEGDMVNLGFTGKWAPTCALRNIDDPNGNKVVVRDAGGGDILTGPEGYGVTQSAAHTYASSNSMAAGVEEYADVRSHSEACAGLLVFGTGADTCIVADIGVRGYGRSEYSSVSGGSSANSFSWGKGIRSQETPFPREPVGSLLLVELPQGVTAMSAVRSVQILTYPQASVVVGDSSDFYLVVNDKQCSPVSASQLGLRVVEMASAGTLSTGLAQAMAEAQGFLRTTARGYIDQGRLLPGQRELLRSAALAKVYDLAHVTSLSAFAESLRNLFETFVNKQIADIDREIELVNIERQIKALLAEEDAIKLDMAAAETSGRVASVLGGLALRNLDLTQLESKTAQVSDLVRDWMEPVVNLRLGGDISFTSADKLILDPIISLSPGGKYADNIAAACFAMDLLTSKLASDALANPDPVVRSVIISIPDPEYLEGSKPEYREVDVATASRVWSALRAGGDLDFTVTPTMFYENKEPFSLSCSLNGPVVRSMGYYLVTADLKSYGTFNSETTVVLSDMLFPRKHELFSYTFKNGLYLKPQVDIMTSSEPGRSTIDSVIGNGGSYWSTPDATTLPSRGTSPFATYHVDMERLRNSYTLPDGTLSDSYPFKNARALLVAFQVEAISQAPSTVLPGVPPCEQ